MLRKLILILFFLSIRLTVISVPAYPGKIKYNTKNNDTVEIYLKGDENNKFAVSMEGYVLVPRNDSWYYLQKDSDNKFVVSNIEIGSGLTRAEAGDFVGVDSNQDNFPIKRIPLREKRQTVYNGISHALVILVEYRDKRFVKTKAEIDNLFNEIGYSADGAQGSVRDFYNYASYGEFDLVSDIYGPYITVNSMDFYGGNSPTGDDFNALKLAIEAIENLPDDIDLSLYDNNCDGVVDNVHIIFSGYGEEAGGPASSIWSHEYPHVLPVEKNGYKFAGYSCTPELRSNFGEKLSRIGVICHELGHALGANDYYDVDYSDNGTFEGTGVWDLMASGSWNNNGVNPANFNPYVKIVDFGWISPIIPQKTGKVSLSSYNFTPSVVRLSTTNPNDYYLLEYRQTQYFDKGLPGEGLMIYHVHPQIENKRVMNTMNSTHPQCLYPVCASSKVSPFLTSDYGDINSEGCPFPGKSNNTEFSGSTMPNAFQWDGNIPSFKIEKIALFEECVSFDLYVDDMANLGTGSTKETITYQEGFEKDLNDFFIELISGKASWEIYPTNKLSTLNDMPKPYEEKHALMLYEGKKSSRCSKSSLMSERIGLSPDSIYSLSFWMRTNEDSSESYQKMSISVNNPETNQWEKIYGNSESVKEWEKIEIELPSNLSSLHYQFTGEVLNCGIFIDDIRINSVGSASIFDNKTDKNCLSLEFQPFRIQSQDPMILLIYDLTGKLVFKQTLSPFEIISPELEKGMYIVCTDKGYKQKIIL